MNYNRRLVGSGGGTRTPDTRIMISRHGTFAFCRDIPEPFEINRLGPNTSMRWTGINRFKPEHSGHNYTRASRSRECLLYPQERTCSEPPSMSA